MADPTEMDSLALSLLGKSKSSDQSRLSDSKCSFTRLTPSVVHAHVLPFLATAKALVVTLARVSRSYRELIQLVPNSIWVLAIRNDFMAAELTQTSTIKRRALAPRDLQFVLQPRTNAQPSPAAAPGATKSPPYRAGACLMHYRAILKEVLPARRLAASAGQYYRPTSVTAPPAGAECDYTSKVILVGEGGAGKTSLMRRFTQSRFQTYYTSTIGADFYTRIVDLPTLTDVPANVHRRARYDFIRGAGSAQSDQKSTSFTHDESMTRKVNLQVWDDGANGQYRGLNIAFYRHCLGTVVVAPCAPLRPPKGTAAGGCGIEPDQLRRAGDWIDEWRRVGTYECAKVVLAISKIDILTPAELASVQAAVQLWLSAFNEKSEAKNYAPVQVAYTSAKSDTGVTELFHSLAASTLAVWESIETKPDVVAPPIAASGAASATEWMCCVQ